MIYDFLNVRNSLRNLTDTDFESKVEQLAEELVDVDYKTKYSEEQLKKDWITLKSYNTESDNTASTVRVGMKLCEHFFPNFYNIKNSKGTSFTSSWNKENLVKILKWNRKSHSTPYMSEIKRGIYFCTGLTKNTMFRPHLAKTVVSCFPGSTVLDPCAGWGGRMLGTLAAGKKYIGFEPNQETYEGLRNLADFLGEKPTLHNTGAENIYKHVSHLVDIVLTSPPYFNLEIYSDSQTQSENMYSTYEEWRDKWLAGVIYQATDCLMESGVSCWNVHNVGKMNMIEDVKKMHEKYRMISVKTFSLTSSKRQANQTVSKNEKNADVTVCYRR
jgi:tRNA1(Val) A37 N6-methylase TrmN6